MASFAAHFQLLLNFFFAESFCRAIGAFQSASHSSKEECVQSAPCDVPPCTRPLQIPPRFPTLTCTPHATRHQVGLSALVSKLLLPSRWLYEFEVSICRIYIHIICRV